MTGTACGDKNNGQNEVCFGKKKKTFFPLFFFWRGGRVLDLVVYLGLSPSFFIIFHNRPLCRVRLRRLRRSHHAGMHQRPLQVRDVQLQAHRREHGGSPGAGRRHG